jgi:hypothetical protein
MSGSFLTGPPREAGEGGKGGISAPSFGCRKGSSTLTSILSPQGRGRSGEGFFIGRVGEDFDKRVHSIDNPVHGRGLLLAMTENGTFLASALIENGGFAQ